MIEWTCLLYEIRSSSHHSRQRGQPDRLALRLALKALWLTPESADRCSSLPCQSPCRFGRGTPANGCLRGRKAKAFRYRRLQRRRLSFRISRVPTSWSKKGVRRAIKPRLKSTRRAAVRQLKFESLPGISTLCSLRARRAVPTHPRRSEGGFAVNLFLRAAVWDDRIV